MYNSDIQPPNAKFRVVTSINNNPLINFIMLGNISAWQILSIRYWLMCFICFRENTETPYSTFVSVAMGSNFCPLTRVRYIFQLQVGADAYGACLVCFQLMSIIAAKCEQEHQWEGFSKLCFPIGRMTLSSLMRETFWPQKSGNLWSLGTKGCIIGKTCSPSVKLAHCLGTCKSREDPS